MTDGNTGIGAAEDGGIIADEKSTKSRKKSVSKSKPVEITFEKYVQLHYGGMDKYIGSYVGERFRGILKTKEGWDKELSRYMEGNK